MHRKELAAWLAEIDLIKNVEDLMKVRAACQHESKDFRRRIKFYTSRRRRELEAPVPGTHLTKPLTREDFRRVLNNINKYPIKMDRVLVHPDDMKDLGDFAVAVQKHQGVSMGTKVNEHICPLCEEDHGPGGHESLASADRSHNGSK